MNVDRLISMFLNQVIRRIMSMGINAGIDQVSRSTKKRGLSPEEEEAKARQKEIRAARRARRAAREK